MVERPCVKIENSESLIRDMANKAVINTNNNERDRVLAARAKKKQESQRIDSLENDVKDIKSTMNKILAILEKTQ